MPRIKPWDLAPLVGFAAWHFENEAEVPEVMERLRRHPVYCQRSDEELRKVVRRALSDLRKWQRIRHCCGWIEGRGCVSWDEANREMTRDAAKRRRSGHGSGDSAGDSGGTGGG